MAYAAKKTNYYQRKRRKKPGFYTEPADPNFTPMLVMEKADSDKLTYPAVAEIKMDGIRAVVSVRDGIVSIGSKRGNDLADRFPSLCTHLARLPNGKYDGEIYHPSVRGPATVMTYDLQSQMNYCVFDLPSLGEYPYVFRRAKLVDIVQNAGDNRITYSIPLGIAQNSSDARKYARLALKDGREGVVLKPLGSKYYAGSRREWLKIKTI